MFKRQVTDIAEITKILDDSKVIHLALSNEDQPYVLPMNYGYVFEDGKLIIYLHGAKAGHKYDLAIKNPKIAFSIESDVKPYVGETACKYGFSYGSVLGKGIASIVDDVEEKIKALIIIMKTQTGKDFEFTEEQASTVNVVRIDVSEFTAKRMPEPQQKL